MNNLLESQAQRFQVRGAFKRLIQDPLTIDADMKKGVMTFAPVKAKVARK